MELISRESAMEAVAPWEFDTDEGKDARRAAKDNIRALPVWKPKGNYCVSAIAQDGIKIGYRMRFVSAASEAEAIGRAIMAFKEREPDWSFSEPSALLVFADMTQSGAAQAPAVKPVAEIKRVSAFLSSMDKAVKHGGYDKDIIHGFDAGCETEVQLLASDLKAILAALDLS